MGTSQQDYVRVVVDRDSFPPPRRLADLLDMFTDIPLDAQISDSSMESGFWTVFRPNVTQGDWNRQKKTPVGHILVEAGSLPTTHR